MLTWRSPVNEWPAPWRVQATYLQIVDSLEKEVGVEVATRTALQLALGAELVLEEARGQEQKRECAPPPKRGSRVAG